MRYLLNTILLYWISIMKLTVGLGNIQSICEDLKEKNNFCSLDTCSHHLNYTVIYYGCHCDINCVRYGTCCRDSQYIKAARPKLKSTCRQVYHGMPCFMVDRCPTSDSVWESQCREELYDDGKTPADIQKIVPVTSLLTSVTYKNYFCFRCHETNDEFIYWNPKLHGRVYSKYYESVSSEELQFEFEKQMYSLTYEDGTWIASFRNGSVRLPLWLSLEIPKEIWPLVRICSTNIITNCSAEWTDSEMSEKCQAYMGIREVKGDYMIKRYKNLHCALCNFEDINNITCITPDGVGGVDYKIYFSFTYLLDINMAEGDKVGKNQKCNDDHIWDSYARKCRKLTCALPGYKIKNGKCEPQ